LFGDWRNGTVELSHVGKIARDIWYEIPERFDHAELDEFVLMPNHFHGIIVICRGLINQTPTSNHATATNDQNKWILMQNPKQTLGKIIRSYKAKITRLVHAKGFNNFVWQRNYYEHIIRNEEEFNKIRQYILNNPFKWHLDRENPERTARDILEDEIFKFIKNT
jgi:REP element-mobilizing transposase RayT